MNPPYLIQGHAQAVIKLSHDLPPSNVYKGWRDCSAINMLAAPAED